MISVWCIPFVSWFSSIFLNKIGREKKTMQRLRLFMYVFIAQLVSIIILGPLGAFIMLVKVFLISVSSYVVALLEGLSGSLSALEIVFATHVCVSTLHAFISF
jgi:hypothetical protein